MADLIPAIRDRTNAPAAVDFILDKLSGYDLSLLDWVRIYPMTDKQHLPVIRGDCPPLTLSTCWSPRDRSLPEGPPLPRHKYRIKVNIWQGKDYPAIEHGWGRVPARPLRRRGPRERFSTRGVCEWSYPDRLSATIHALARAIFLFLADTRQLGETPSNSNASAWGHRWAVEWLHENGQQAEAEAMSAQLVKWHLIQSKGV